MDDAETIPKETLAQIRSLDDNSLKRFIFELTQVGWPKAAQLLRKMAKNKQKVK
jgi:hypothetical protein